MESAEAHPSDENLLRAADGEISGRRGRQIRRHLAACPVCRGRVRDMEGTIARFVHFHQTTLEPQLPPAAGPRALLKARLRDLMAANQPHFWPRPLQFSRFRNAAACLCLVLLCSAAAVHFLSQRSLPGPSNLPNPPIESMALPNRSLTPGMQRSISLNEVCSMEHEEVVRAIPASLRQEVFREYGLTDVRQDDYEVDFLIAPGLGGAEDIRNLWPQPYKLPVWNARMKDALEERLHQLVCEGKLDLSTAQHDIATDWVAAYKKYFKVNQAVSEL
jgi:Putative zinc-finger